MVIVSFINWSSFPCTLTTIFHSICEHVQIPNHLTWNWWRQTSVVYVRVNFHSAAFYVGATDLTVFSREQARDRKYHQLVSGQMAYFEPALKLWQAQKTYYDFVVFPLVATSSCNLYQLETSIQKALQFSYNRHWVNPMLKRWRIGQVMYALPTLVPGSTSLRRYRHLTMSGGDRRSILSRRLPTIIHANELLFQLGSDSYQKFTTSRILRSSTCDVNFIFLLWKVSHLLPEPARTRAQLESTTCQYSVAATCDTWWYVAVSSTMAKRFYFPSLIFISSSSQCCSPYRGDSKSTVESIFV